MIPTALLALSIPTKAITSAFLLKLTTSLDDLLWLSPFLSLSPSVHSKLKHSVVYFIICVVVTMLAFIFGTSLVALTSSSSNSSGSNNNSYWRPERFLSIISASVLFYVARNDFLEWKEENYQHNDQTKNAERRSSVEILYPKKKEKKQDEENKNYIYSNSNNNNSRSIELKDFTNNNTTTPQPQQQLRSRSYASRQSSRDLEAAGDSDEKDDESDNTNGDDDDDDDDDDDEEIRAKVEEASKSLRRFVTVCVMGTLDDMIVFSAFVAGGGGGSKGNGTGLDGTDETVDVAGDELEFRHNNFALFIGTTLAALLIVAISWFFSEIECFKRIVKKIPMWALLTGIAIYILVMGLI